MTYADKCEAWKRFYNRGFRRAVHQLLAWGYEDARPTIKPTHLEEEITGFIVDAIKNRLDDPYIPSKFRRFQIEGDSHVRNSNKTGKYCQRIDIVISSSLLLPRPEFMFEAKILRKNGFPISEYIGYDGLQRFLREEYAKEYTAAGMIGYVQSDNCGRWYKELERVFASDREGRLKIKINLQVFNILPSLPYEWVSTHVRKQKDDIDIFHIFLDCL